MESSESTPPRIRTRDQAANIGTDKIEPVDLVDFDPPSKMDRETGVGFVAHADHAE
jgi:hypothetical protein